MIFKRTLSFGMPKRYSITWRKKKTKRNIVHGAWNLGQVSNSGTSEYRAGL